MTLLDKCLSFLLFQWLKFSCNNVKIICRVQRSDFKKTNVWLCLSDGLGISDVVVVVVDGHNIRLPTNSAFSEVRTAAAETIIVITVISSLFRHNFHSPPVTQHQRFDTNMDDVI